MQFVVFQANFPDLKVLAEAKEPIARPQVARLLGKARSVCAFKAYDYAPIDRKLVQAVAAKAGKVQNIGALAAVLKGTSLSKLGGQLRPAVKFLPVDDNKKQAEEKKIEYAVDYYVYLLFSQVFPQDVSAEGKPEKSEARLVANTQGWLVVKKADLAAPTPKEVLAGLIGITESARNKHADFLCRENGSFDSVCGELLAKLSPRKSFGKVAQVLELDEKAIEARLAQIAANPQSGEDLKKLKELFYLEALAQAGFSPYVPVELLNETYPELKIPKPRGNFGGKGKKKK
ncbi:MAG: hypothetical protein WC792_01445 [Candidatus Micrarchaeia archaeon]|jgi:hypothetical protein